MNGNHPFFIVGSPRSGTTLLVRKLNNHSRLFIPPETAFFYALETMEKDNEVTKDCLNLNEFVNEYANWKSVSFLGIEADMFSQILLRDASSFKDIFLNLMNHLTKDSGKSRWGEKTPHHLSHVKRINEMFPDAKFLCLLRDGRAVVRSRLGHPYWKDNLVSAAVKWQKDITTMKTLENKYGPDSFMIIRYEKLLKEPNKVLRKVLQFIGEEFENGLLDSASGCNKVYNDYYGQPWMNKSTKEIDPERAIAWLSSYSENELKVVESILDKELRELDYELRSDSGIITWRILKYKMNLDFLLSRIFRKLIRVYGKII